MSLIISNDQFTNFIRYSELFCIYICIILILQKKMGLLKIRNLGSYPLYEH